VRAERPLPVDDQPPRITELWAWTTLDPMTDVEGILGGKLPGLGIAVPLVTSMRRLAERLRPIAEEAVRGMAEPRPILMLRHFVPAPGDVGPPEPP